MRLGPTDGLNRTVSWNAPVVDKEGNIYLGQELQRSPYVPCRFHGEKVHNGILCGEFMSFDSAGNLRWKVRTDGGTLGAQFTNDGKLVFQTWRGTIYIFDPDLKLDNSGRIISFLNSFPESAKKLMDYPTNEVVTECLYKAQNDKCITANIVAVSPQTGAIYNTVQGFVKGVRNSFLQRWNYDERTNRVTIDSGWNTDANLIGGCPSSPDISFDGKSLFVHDLDGNIFALDSDSGDTIHTAIIGYVPVGSSTTAPEFDHQDNLVGTYITFQRSMDLESEFNPYVRIMRYKNNEGYLGGLLGGTQLGV